MGETTKTISMDDADAIKAALLRATGEGHGSADPTQCARDLVAAFAYIDSVTV